MPIAMLGINKGSWETSLEVTVVIPVKADSDWDQHCSSEVGKGVDFSECVVAPESAGLDRRLG